MVDWITETIRTLGYPGVALVMFLENIFPPIPSELIMPFAGMVAAQGDLSLVGVIVAGTIGSVLGTMPLYLIGRYFDDGRLRCWAERHGAWLTIGPEDIDRARDWFDRHGAGTVFFCRMVPGLRTVISLPAGASGMNFLVYLVYTTLGSAAWAAILAYLGRILGQNYDAVRDYLGPVTWVVIGGLFLWYVFRLVQQYRGRGSQERARA